MGGSDLHLSPGAAPRLRIDGRLTQAEGEPLSAEVVESMVSAGIPDRPRALLGQGGEADYAFTLTGVARFPRQRVPVSRRARGRLPGGARRGAVTRCVGSAGERGGVGWTGVRTRPHRRSGRLGQIHDDGGDRGPDQPHPRGARCHDRGSRGGHPPESPRPRHPAAGRQRHRFLSRRASFGTCVPTRTW